MADNADITTPFLTINNEPVYFEEDWSTGIGGGLWSTGLALAKYFELQQKEIEKNVLRSFPGKNELDVLELGSGNGFLSACLLALLKGHIGNLVSTDLADHLDLMNQTLEANKHLVSSQDKVKVMEHKWGEFTPAEDDDSLEARVNSGVQKFDLIVGSDVAYRPFLYDILIESLLRFSDNNTIILLGVTMKDTTPTFFHKLHDAGFSYNRVADNQMPLEFRGTTFGIIVVKKIGS
jgi:predicted nicotinamide N-methyase